jgi:hypothetical protein
MGMMVVEKRRADPPDPKPPSRGWTTSLDLTQTKVGGEK